MNGTAGTVVVGVDGSACGAKAAQWAQAYAERYGLSITLVTAWNWPTSYGVPLVLNGFDPEEDAQKTVEAGAASLTLPPGRIRTIIHQGAPGDVLVRASTDATLLVVGTRGHGSVAGALIGSTSNYCTHHASCPVVVVR
jgi:nucleotide-binding universal stress UspA family protein